LRSKALLTALLLATASMASATIVVLEGPGNFAGDENVLFQDDDTGNPLGAVTNQTNTGVNFTSNQVLSAPSGGQARVESNTATDLSNLGIDLVDPLLFFTTAIFNIDATANSSIALSVDWVCATGATCAGGATGTFNNNFNIGQNGENFFRIQAVDNQLIDNISFTTAASAAVIENVSQIRLGGVTDEEGGGGPSEIPEPMTMGLFGGGLLGLATYRKLKHR
jgi:hypothetical protein